VEQYCLPILTKPGWKCSPGACTIKHYGFVTKVN
jgi:hypothetical protein